MVRRSLLMAPPSTATELHLEQRMANDGHLTGLSRKAPEEMEVMKW